MCPQSETSIWTKQVTSTYSGHVTESTCSEVTSPGRLLPQYAVVRRHILSQRLELTMSSRTSVAIAVVALSLAGLSALFAVWLNDGAAAAETSHSNVFSYNAAHEGAQELDG